MAVVTFRPAHLQALEEAGLTRAEAQRLLDVLAAVPEDARDVEELYEDIISWGNKWTGGNAAFDEDVGFHALNELRHLLGLPLRPEGSR